MERMLLRKYRPHKCNPSMKPLKVSRTAKTRNDLIYLRENGEYKYFQVEEVITKKKFRCKQFVIEPKKFNRTMELDFSLVGVFHNRGKMAVERNVKMEEICGKVFSHKGLLMSIPMNVLLEI